jgi:hypothetical protein
MSLNSHLSLALQKKTNKIISLKKSLTAQEELLILLYTAAFFSCIYCYKSRFVYFDYIYHFFTHQKNIFLTPSVLDLTVLTVAAISLLLISYLSDKLSSTKEQYNKLRLDIIHTIEGEFCYHPQRCSCKDNYISEMDKYSIDMVFK